MTTQVVNLYKEAFDIYIGRPGKGQDGFWGNPFSIAATDPRFRVASRDEAVAKHKAWLPTQSHLLQRLPELKGRRLGCFCKPKACHGDNFVSLLEANNLDD